MTTTVWILGDQLLKDHPALDQALSLWGKNQVVVLMIESQARADRLPYHRWKLTLLFSAMRHYAQTLQEDGFRVDYRAAPTTRSGISQHLEDYSPDAILTMAASEARGRRYQHNLESVFNLPTTVLPNTQFLSGRYNPFPDPKPGKRIIQEQFYRRMRVHFDLLMGGDGEPLGGEWNYDKLNRKRLPKDDKPAGRIRFEPDTITHQVMADLSRSSHATGSFESFDLAVTHEQAKQAANDFFDHRLANFGPYEDAMSADHAILYHSHLSPYLNLGLLDPLQLAMEAEARHHAGEAPLNSVEGFIRQIIGWREYIYWQYWRLKPENLVSNFWAAQRPLPEMFWDGDTRMNCLYKVINRALTHGYTHHIERLMILCNFFNLAGVDPDAVNDWFLSTFIDAYEWVMLPNVYGMGLFADGGKIATKPYLASANYINKMSDYCQGCTFDRKRRTGKNACPFNTLYWNFLLKHEGKLRSIPRMSTSLLGLRHLDEAERKRVQQSAETFLDNLQ